MKLCAIKYNDKAYESITHTMLYQQICDRQHQDLIKLNYLYPIVVYDYCEWFILAIIHNEISEMESYIMNMGSQILDLLLSGNLKLDISKISNIIDSLLQGASKLSSSQHDVLNSKLLQVSSMAKLLIGGKSSK